MYAKITDGKIKSVSRKPNWRMGDGSPISDEELAKRGRLPVHREPPEYDGETQRLKQRSQDEWVIYKDRAEVAYTVEDIPQEELKQRAIRGIDRQLDELDRKSIADIRRAIANTDDTEAVDRLKALESEAETLRTERDTLESEAETRE